MNLLPKIPNTKHTAVDVYGEMYYVKWHRVPKVSYESRATTNSAKIADDNGREFALILLILIVANFCPK